MARIAVVQQAPVFLDRAATLARAVAAVHAAAAGGAALVVFPEAFVPGYPSWIWQLRPGADMGLTERLHARLRAPADSLAGNDKAGRSGLIRQAIDEFLARHGGEAA